MEKKETFYLDSMVIEQEFYYTLRDRAIAQRVKYRECVSSYYNYDEDIIDVSHRLYVY